MSWGRDFYDRILGLRFRLGFGLVTVIALFVVFRVRDYDDLPQDLFQLVAPCLFIPSPLDDNIKTQGLDSLSRIDPAGLAQKVIITSVYVPYVG
jgi:hypothetical protein